MKQSFTQIFKRAQTRRGKDRILYHHFNRILFYKKVTNNFRLQRSWQLSKFGCGCSIIIGSDGKKARMTAAVDKVESAEWGARPSCSVSAAAAAPFDRNNLIKLKIYFSKRKRQNYIAGSQQAGLMTTESTEAMSSSSASRLLQQQREQFIRAVQFSLCNKSQ